MILLTQKIGSGPTKRCDARCYNATKGECKCICAGRNHGAGIKTALENVKSMFAPIVLCEHNKIIGMCPEGCYKPKGRVGDVKVPRRALRELKHREEAANAGS